MSQLSLLPGVERAERPWKVVRRVSKAVYAELRKSGAVSKSTYRVITALAYYRNRSMAWPTPAELTAFMYRLRRIPREDARLVAPRITELIRGAVVTLDDGSKVRKGGGVCDQLPVRRCTITGRAAHPVAIREIGSAMRWVA